MLEKELLNLFEFCIDKWVKEESNYFMSKKQNNFIQLSECLSEKLGIGHIDIDSFINTRDLRNYLLSNIDNLKEVVENFEVAKQKAIVEINKDYSSFMNMCDELKNNKEVAIEAYTRKEWMIDYIGDTLKKDKEFILNFLKSYFNSSEIFSEKDIMQKIVLIAPFYYQHIDVELQNDKEFSKKLLRKNKNIYLYFNETLKNDEDIVRMLINKTSDAIHYLDDSWKINKEMMLIVINKFPSNFCYLHNDLKNDDEFGLLVMDKAPWEFRNLGEKLRAKKKFVLIAVEDNGSSFEYTTKELKNDKAFILECLKVDNYASSIKYIDKELKENKKFLIKCLKINENCIDHFDEKLKADRNIQKIVQSKEGTNLTKSKTAKKSGMDIYLDTIEIQEKKKDNWILSLCRSNTIIQRIFNCKN